MIQDLIRRASEWLNEANTGQLCLLACCPIIAVVLLALVLHNPTVEQVPISDPVTVEVKRHCTSAPGPCVTCLPGADGTLDCASVTFGTCPGTQLTPCPYGFPLMGDFQFARAATFLRTSLTRTSIFCLWRKIEGGNYWAMIARQGFAKDQSCFIFTGCYDFTFAANNRIFRIFEFIIF